MPGRKSHGRPLIASKPQAKTFRKSKAKAQVKALDAFTIASEQYPTKHKRNPRFRDIEGQADSGKKHRLDDDDDDEDGDEDGDDDDDEQPRRKRVKASSARGDGGESDEYGSDSEGNEWHYGVNEDEDSELDSDEAFGESDEEDFQGYSFRGSKGAKNEGGNSEEEDDDESLGEDAIDLAQALDEYESDESMQDRGSGSEGSDSDSEADSPPSSDSEDGEDEEADPSRLGALQKFITSYGGEKDEDAAGPTKQKQKISFKDLGLSGVKDAQMRKSVKLMAKEGKETRPGGGKKLDVPLARRQQDKLARAAAYEKANETLGRWQDTVKHNRRAEHLVFPLPQNAADEGLDNRELQAITAKGAAAGGNELERTILSIMQASGLAMNKQEENRMRKEEEEEGLSKEALKDLVNQRRRERELNSREAKRAARIKKIKSKAYHRVHRKEKEREEMKLHEAMAENGEVDSEAEREAADRARALERVGAKHRDSKWAKLGASNKRAVWDEEYRVGLHDMARREEELRQRKEGRAGRSDSEEEEESSSDDDDDDGEGSDEEGREKRKLLKQLNRLENEEDDGLASKLMQMKFMQKAEAQQKKANDELIAQIRRDMASGGEESDEEEVTEVGRKKFGSAAKPAISAPALSRKKSKKATAADANNDNNNDDNDDDYVRDNSAVNAGYSVTAEASTTGSAWSSGPRKKSSKTQSGLRVADLDNSQAMTAAAPPKSKSRSKGKTGAYNDDDDEGEEEDVDSDEGADIHLPLAIRDIAQMDKAFAGDDVVVDFARQKAEIEAEDGEKVVDNTLPGWGGWVGEGVSKREQKRQQGRFVTKVEGVKKANRKDAKLDKVIISEKRVKKNDKYLASQLPHPFESKAQYERSLRLPLGPEWVTKESFQDAIKPRILKKQGIIAPMSRPTL